MSIGELEQELGKLTRLEKLRIVQRLVNEIAAEENAIFTDGGVYEVWSPYDSAGAAHQLMQMLEEDKTNHG